MAEIKKFVKKNICACPIKEKIFSNVGRLIIQISTICLTYNMINSFHQLEIHKMKCNPNANNLQLDVLIFFTLVSFISVQGSVLLSLLVSLHKSHLVRFRYNLHRHQHQCIICCRTLEYLSLKDVTKLEI